MMVEHSDEKVRLPRGPIKGGAAVTGAVPSAQFVPPTLNLDRPPSHDFVPVAGHPDDDECTHRSDGTDATYCGLTAIEHEHHPDCYQSTGGIPEDLPADLCDCRVLRMIDAASSLSSAAPEPKYADCTCGHPYDGHDAEGCFPACGCSDPGPAPSRITSDQ